MLLDESTVGLVHFFREHSGGPGAQSIPWVPKTDDVDRRLSKREDGLWCSPLPVCVRLSSWLTDNVLFMSVQAPLVTHAVIPTYHNSSTICHPQSLQMLTTR
jgi:hypothetical protein